ncbi:hypothetical protein EDB89DRAFT_2005705 [Lactarius sanguifluus]|nr:hypothetical protein EDB89DRAFT_2005705 [Lactarius sanguifluus]
MLDSTPALKPAALFSALGGALKVLVLVLVPPMWTSRTRGRLLGALGNTGAELERLKLSLQMGYAMAVRLGSGTDWSCAVQASRLAVLERAGHAGNQVFQGESSVFLRRRVRVSP